MRIQPTFSLLLLCSLISGICLLVSPNSELLGSTEDSKPVVAAKESLSKLQKFLKAGQWDNVMPYLSEEGKQSLSIEVCYSLAISGEIAANGSDGLPPGIAELAKRIATVNDKYKLDEIGKLIFDGKPKEALKKLEATGRQWEIVDALWKAQSDSPFHVHPAFGEVLATEEGSDSIFFDIEMQPISDVKSEDGVVFDMKGPAQVIRMKKIGDEWKYDGVDEKRTMARMEKFLAEAGPEAMGMAPPKLLDDPSFKAKTVDGSMISLSDFKGKVVVLDFWGTWCGPCVAAMPKMKLIHEAFAEHGVEIIGVAVDRKESVAEFCEQKKIPWPNVVDPEGKLADHFGVAAFPTLMVIDKDGKHVIADIEKTPLVEDLIQRLGLAPPKYAELMKKLKEKDKLPDVDTPVHKDS